ncbi:MAG TPA: hypothetical protein VNC23_01475 [Lapillicoccus sp.]|jgi:hypothetical protein|nr:hypothetical protein [Lapillicoccus sp.]
MTHTAQTLTGQPLRSGRTPTLLAAVTAAATHVRTRRQAAKESIRPVPFDPELHLMPPFAVLVSGLR